MGKVLKFIDIFFSITFEPYSFRHPIIFLSFTTLETVLKTCQVKHYIFF